MGAVEGADYPCGLLVTTSDGTIISANETLAGWIGCRASDLVGRRFADLLTPGGRIYHETHYAPVLRVDGRVDAVALHLVGPERTRLPVLVTSEAGPDSTVRTVVFDATDRRSYEDELLRERKAAEAAEARAVRLARTLQQTLIPPSPPEVDGLDLAAAYRPAGDGDEVGGDFYDVFEVAADDWVVVVGDVCGKGVDAAVVTAAARHAVRRAAVHHPLPSTVLHEVNEALLEHPSDRFCTATLLRLRRHAGAWRVTASSGGHPLPVLVTPGGQRKLGAPGSLLGIEVQTTFVDAEAELRPGDAVVVYTDGVTEGRRDRELYGDDRLAAAITAAGGGPASELTDFVLADVMAFQDERPRDDIVILTVKSP